jgi:3-hydroxyisobutyrate dehydrogenase-like beta-hydroxyacid dehydrogenase
MTETMTPTVAIIAPGNMGAAVAKRLTEHKVTVLTILDGRSDASIKRAQQAGMQGVDERRLAEADFILSIVPPGDALALAQRLAGVLTQANTKPIYVECNATSPQTVNRIAETIAPTGCAFVGAGIIGPPPKPGTTNTKFYASGAQAKEFARLNDFGLIVRVLDGPLTAASALKMSYAGVTKGFTALGASRMLAATRGGSAQALQAELAESQPALLGYLSRMVPAMYSKSYRWVAEMEEISDFIGGDHAEHAMMEAAARFYERIAADFDGGKREIGAMDAFIAGAAAESKK